MAAGFLAGRWYIAAIFVATCTIQSSVTGQNVEVSPRSAVVLPGQNVSVLCKVAYQITYCRIEIPGKPALSMVAGLSDGGISYFGKGFEFGECGLTLDKVEDINNGQVKCTVSPQAGTFAEPYGNMTLIVAKAPYRPELQYSRGSSRDGSFQVDEELKVMCVVREGRPEAKIIWYMDDEVIMNGVSMPSINEVPGSAGLTTTSQNITRRLKATDHNRVIKCVADHPALDDSSKSAQLQISVKYRPEPLESIISIFGIKISETGIINVTFQANPPPTLEWNFDGQTLRGGSVDPTGRFEAATPISLGYGFYNATLRIMDITREDTERDYTLKAYNEMGQTEYHIKISTADEPQGVELDAGSIIGIVVAVLVVLIAVFLVIFAKATNRWCFGGGVLRTDIPDAGDSEAPLPGEKAEHGSIGAVNPSHEEYVSNGNGKVADIKSNEKPDTAV